MHVMSIRYENEKILENSFSKTCVWCAACIKYLQEEIRASHWQMPQPAPQASEYRPPARPSREGTKTDAGRIGYRLASTGTCGTTGSVWSSCGGLQNGT